MREIMGLLIQAERPPEFPVARRPVLLAGHNRLQTVNQGVNHEIDETKPPQRRAENQKDDKGANGMNPGMREQGLVAVPAGIALIQSHPSCLQHKIADNLLGAETEIENEQGG